VRVACPEASSLITDAGVRREHASLTHAHAAGRVERAKRMRQMGRCENGLQRVILAELADVGGGVVKRVGEYSVSSATLYMSTLPSH
jgi:hypothetical protein